MVFAKLLRLALVGAFVSQVQIALADPVTPIAEVQRGAVVTVVGTVEAIPDEDEFRLADASGSLLVYVGPNRVPAEIGETVTVTGRIDDDTLTRQELCASSLTRADGSVVVFEQVYE